MKLRRLRFTAAEIAETLAMPLSTVSGILTRSGMGRLGRLGLEQPVRYERSRPGELVHVDVKKLGRIEGGAGKRWRDGLHTHYNADPHRPWRQATQHGRLGVRPRRRRRLQPPRLRRGPQRRESDNRDRASSTARVAFYRRHGITRRTLLTDNGSAYRADDPRARLPTTRHPPPPHPALPATDKRQSRTLHPHHAQRLGLRRRSTAQAKNAPPPLTAGSGTTTIDADTQPSATNPRSPEPTCSGPTSSPASRGQLARARLTDRTPYECSRMTPDTDGRGCAVRVCRTGTLGLWKVSSGRSAAASL